MLSYQPQAIRVIIVDDHELTRFSLKLLLSRQKNIQVVALAGTGKEAIELVKLHHPDVVILDLQMPVMNGITAATIIKENNPDTQIIAYSSLEYSQLEIISQTADIDAVCPKEVATEALINLVYKLGQQALSYQ